MQELPFGERSAKHILFYIFKQIVNYKKQDSSKTDVRFISDCVKIEVEVEVEVEVVYSIVESRFHSTRLRCDLLSCTVLYCPVLYCIVLYCIVYSISQLRTVTLCLSLSSSASSLLFLSSLSNSASSSHLILSYLILSLPLRVGTVIRTEATTWARYISDTN